MVIGRLNHHLAIGAVRLRSGEEGDEKTTRGPRAPIGHATMHLPSMCIRVSRVDESALLCCVVLRRA